MLQKLESTLKNRVLFSYNDLMFTKRLTQNEYDVAAKLLLKGKVGVLPTDTIYGIHALTQNIRAVEKIYKLKQRNETKPFIVLIPSVTSLRQFGIIPDIDLEKYWPGPVSIIFPCKKEEFAYLHRGTNQLSFRVPDKEQLRMLLQETGPLVSTSANKADLPAARNVEEAKKYFGNKINFYLDEGELVGKPSKIVKITGNVEFVLRE